MSEARHVALVTGGAVRVGRAISKSLAEAGYAVAVNYHSSAAAATSLVEELSARGAEVTALRGDVTTADAIDGLVDAVTGRWGAIDLLVNNAATFEAREFFEVDEELWRHNLELNLEAPFRLCREVGALMWTRGRGRIVNICGTVGIQPPGRFMPYRVSKAALSELTRCVADALAPRVQVNGVAPGAVLFPEGTSEQERARVLETVPAGEPGSPEDVARTVLFLAEAPEYITGAILPVDGGASLRTG